MNIVIVGHQTLVFIEFIFTLFLYPVLYLYPTGLGCPVTVETWSTYPVC